uniref:Pseudouridine synthase n=1 Tax=Candidatus Methanomethylicus mesodigestus TaxID=1867258 RepID=A0A7C3IXZ9_9CREN
MQQAEPTYSPITSDDLIRVRAVADYQFGKGAGEILFPDNIEAVKSRKTGKVKAIYENGTLLATLKPSDGFLALAIGGAKRLKTALKFPSYRVAVLDEVVDVIKEGRNVFAKHVFLADPKIRPGEEVLVTDRRDEIIAVGRAALNGEEMKRFKIGLAVKVRKGDTD